MYHVHICISTYIHLYIHTYIYIYIYVHIHIMSFEARDGGQRLVSAVLRLCTQGLRVCKPHSALSIIFSIEALELPPLSSGRVAVQSLLNA